MPDYNYITKEEVQSVCETLCFRDWTELGTTEVEEAEAATVRQIVGAEALDIPLTDFKLGLEIELEHGTKFPDANITNNHPILTGRIVLAHLKEGLDYYVRLQCMELEMELLKALAAKDVDKSMSIRRELAENRATLESSISQQLR